MNTDRAIRPLEDVLAGQFTPLDDATAERWRTEGWWENRSIRSLLSEAARLYPDRTALVGRSRDGGRVTMTYREFDGAASHAARVLLGLGVGPGDAVAVMLPNWIEYPSIVFGVNQVGAIYVGIPVAHGEQQVAAVLRRSRAKVLIIPRRWRRGDHLAVSRRLSRDLPDLERVVVLDEDEADLLSGEERWSGLQPADCGVIDDPDPDGICYLGFTSGTTGEPKGAMHNHNSLIYSARQLARHTGPSVFGEPMVQLVASPCGHHTGFVWGILFTVLVGGTGVHVDRWDPSWGAEVIREEGVTTFFGAPTFLQDLLRTDLAGDPGCPLTCVVIAGAPIPRGLPAMASEALGAYIAPAWGMTECSIVISATPSQPKAITRTDGSVLAGSSVKIVDDKGTEVPTGQVGHLLVHGPALAYGYFDRPDATAEAFRPGLWFDTGDRASVDEKGWVSLAGRTKDIIIRGGENIPVTDVESLVFDHPDVLEVAVVGVPDQRLGERIGAVLVVKPGSHPPSVQSLGDFLTGRGLSQHYLPERVRVVEELPKTPSGKIQKFRLTEGWE